MEVTLEGKFTFVSPETLNFWEARPIFILIPHFDFRDYTIVCTLSFACIYCKFEITITYESLLRNLLYSKVLLLAFVMGGNEFMQKVLLIISKFIMLRPEALPRILQLALKHQPPVCILVSSIPVDQLPSVLTLLSGFEFLLQSWHVKIFFLESLAMYLNLLL